MILAAPKIGPRASVIRTRVAELLGLHANCVGLKAKTPEGLNLDNTAIAHVVVLLEKSARPEEESEEEKSLAFVGRCFFEGVIPSGAVFQAEGGISRGTAASFGVSRTPSKPHPPLSRRLNKRPKNRP